MSSEVAIKVNNLSKCYHTYNHPGDRLKQSFASLVQRGTGGHARRYYREFWALRDVSFEISRGESFGIVGSNGSGKSTLLQLICGTLTPTSGAVDVQGRVAALLELGSGFNPEFSGRENVYLNGALLGLTRAQVDQRFDAIAAFADIGDFLDQPVKTYSSGMMVRLAFAVQVQVEPDVLIVDEALAVGDALFQKRCYSRIEKLLSDGLTLLFVSHDQESVRTLTRRSILLGGGRVQASGRSSDVLLAYRKQLHMDESRYFSSVAQAASARPEAGEALSKGEITPASPCIAAPDAATIDPGPRTDGLSFGDGGIHITSVNVVDRGGQPCQMFSCGDLIRIQVKCLSLIDTDKINVAVRIRNREGIKVYSWGTLNQDMRVLAGKSPEKVFWSKWIRAGETIEVWLEFECTLGPNLYEVQASVTHEDTPDYAAQRMLHWKDEAAFFYTATPQDAYFFGGLADLRMSARWE